MPLPAPPFTFRPLADFESPELRSHYVKGLEYTVRAGNAKLAALVEKWLVEKKVEVGPTFDHPVPPPVVAKVSGKGKVK